MKQLKILSLVLVFLSTFLKLNAQNDIKFKDNHFWYQVSIGKEDASLTSPNAWLELGKYNTLKGFILPRTNHLNMTPEEGNFIYDFVDKALYYGNGTGWISLASSTQLEKYDSAFVNGQWISTGRILKLYRFNGDSLEINIPGQTLALSGNQLSISGGNNVSLTTDNVFEGTTNLYFTNARSRAAITNSAPITYNPSTGLIGHSTSGVTAGTYNNVTVNSFGHVTSGTNQPYLIGLNAINGLTYTSGTNTIKIGGTLTENTTIAGGGTNSFTLNNTSSITLGGGTSSLVLNNTGNSLTGPLIMNTLNVSTGTYDLLGRNQTTKVIEAIPTSGFIFNTTTLQPSSNFNISGTGKATNFNTNSIELNNIGGTGIFTVAATSNNLNFAYPTGSRTPLTLNTAGAVGINNTNPLASLDINMNTGGSANGMRLTNFFISTFKGNNTDSIIVARSLGSGIAEIRYVPSSTFITTETDPVATAKTIALTAGSGISITGGTQSIGSNPTFTINNTGVLTETDPTAIKNQSAVDQSASGRISGDFIASKLHSYATTGSVDITLHTSTGFGDGTVNRRWGIGKLTTEAAGNIGNDFAITRFDNSGSPISAATPPLKITRSTGEVTLGTINNEATDVDKFLVSNTGAIRYRTGTQVLSDISAAPAVGSPNYIQNQAVSAQASANAWISGSFQSSSVKSPLYTDDGTSGLIFSSSNAGMTFNNGGATQMTFSDDGRLGIGFTPNPVRASLLEVNGNVWSNDAYILGAGTGSAPTAEFGLSGTNNAFVRTMGTGNVTFQTNSNTVVATVNGTTNNFEVTNRIKIGGGTPGIGKVLTDADGTGLAQWTTIGGGTGTVTSVGLTSSDITVGGATSPITTSGTYTLTLPNINSNIGTFNNLTVNAKGQVTAGSNVSYLTTETDPIVSARTLTFTAGTGVSITGGTQNLGANRTWTITNSAPDQTVALTAGTGISVSGTYPNFTITNTSPMTGSFINNGTSPQTADFNITGGASIGGNIQLTNTTSNFLNFSAFGIGAPTFTTRSVGTKVVYYPAVAAGAVDFAMGIENSHLWSSVPTAANSNGFKWYGGTTQVGRLDGLGSLELTGQGRFRGWYSANGVGPAAEVGYSAGYALLYGFDRTASSYIPLRLAGGSTNVNFRTFEIDGTGYKFPSLTNVDLLGTDASGYLIDNSAGFIKNGSTVQTAQFSINGTGNAGQFTAPYLTNGASTGSVNLVGGAAAAGASRGAEIALRGGTYATTPGEMTFHTGTGGSNTVQPERMRIKASGNVGVGTSSPSNKLEVAGGDGLDPVAGTWSGAFGISNSPNAYGMNFGVKGNGTSFIQGQRKDGTTTLYPILLNPLGGNIGINTTSNPTSTLFVDGTFENTGSASFATSGAPVTINGLGQVSVGATLSVTGQVNFSSNLNVTGTITAGGGGFNSLRSLKKDITIFNKDALKLIEGLKIYNFKYKNNNKDQFIGMVIDEKNEVPKELLMNDGTAINTYNTISLLIKSIQQLNERLEKLEKQVNK